MKLDVHNLIYDLYWTPIFKWYVVRCGFKSRYQKDRCLKEAEQCAQNIITISKLNRQKNWEGLYDHSTSIMEKPSL